MVVDIRVSEVNIIPVKPKRGLLAFCTFVINDALYIRDIAIYNCLSRPEGIRLNYPARKLPNGDTVNVIHPINREADAIITRAIAEEFEKVIDMLRGSELRNHEGVLRDEQEE